MSISARAARCACRSDANALRVVTEGGAVQAQGGGAVQAQPSDARPQPSSSFPSQAARSRARCE